MTNFESLSINVISGRIDQVKEQVRTLLDEGLQPLDIVSMGLISGMNVVGARFKNGEMFVPEVLMAAKAMSAGMEIIKPFMSESDLPGIGTVILGTVKGDLHDIGKNLVGMMLESAGFTVINLGIDITPVDFIEAAKKNNADIIAMSALLTTTMLGMKDTIDLLKEEGLRENLRVIIGGAPISQDFADEIGADGFAPDAASAVDLCKHILSEIR